MASDNSGLLFRKQFNRSPATWVSNLGLTPGANVWDYDGSGGSCVGTFPPIRETFSYSFTHSTILNAKLSEKLSYMYMYAHCQCTHDSEM